MSCLACGHPNPQTKERLNPERVYCDSQCQTLFYVGLKDGEIDDPEKVGLIAKDGKRFIVSIEEASKSKTLKLLIEDAQTDNYIPLPNIDSEVLEVIVNYMRRKDTEELLVDKIETYKLAQISSNLSEEFVLRLMDAINYLDIHRLFCLIGVVNVAKDIMFKNYSPKKFWDFCQRYNSFLIDIIACMTQSERSTTFKMFKREQKFDQLQAQLFKQITTGPAGWAVASGNIDMVIVLSFMDAKSSDKSAYGFQTKDLVRIAAEEGQVKILQWFIKNWHNFHIVFPVNLAFKAAIMRGHLEVLKIIPIEPEIEFSKLLGLSVRYANIEVVQFMLGITSERNIPFDYEQLIEIAGDREDIIHLILTWRDQPNQETQETTDYTDSIQKAILTNNSKSLRLILDSMQKEGINIDYDAYIEYAEQYEHDFIVGLLKQWKSAKRIRINKRVK